MIDNNCQYVLLLMKNIMIHHTILHKSLLIVEFIHKQPLKLSKAKSGHPRELPRHADPARNCPLSRISTCS